LPGRKRNVVLDVMIIDESAIDMQTQIIIITNHVNKPAATSVLNSNKHSSPSAQPALPEQRTLPRRLTSAELFAGSDQLVIEHQGAEYQLRVTRQGKLILTK
jgi:hemin uptake protein HemP